MIFVVFSHKIVSRTVLDTCEIGFQKPFIDDLSLTKLFCVKL